jgi:hypothetical protein
MTPQASGLASHQASAARRPLDSAATSAGIVQQCRPISDDAGLGMRAAREQPAPLLLQVDAAVQLRRDEADREGVRLAQRHRHRRLGEQAWSARRMISSCIASSGVPT